MTPLRALPSSLTQSYGLAPADFSFLAEVQNIVFGFAQNGVECVLRLTPETHRSFAQVQAEIDWLNHLSSQGLRVSTPVAAEDGSLCRRLDGKDRIWTATAFTKAPGRIGAAQDWNADTFRAWGAMTGRLHLATESYEPRLPLRPDWIRTLPADPRESEDEQFAS